MGVLERDSLTINGASRSDIRQIRSAAGYHSRIYRHGGFVDVFEC